MYARIVSAQADPKNIDDESFRLLGESLAASACIQPGNRGFLGFFDHSTGKVMAVTLWETPQDLEASECNGYLRRQLARAQPILGGPVVRETYEVVAHAGLTEEKQPALATYSGSGMKSEIRS
jgi:hypothetical protein